MTSQQVNWWTVHEFVTPTLERIGSWPMVGTPAWQQLDDADPRKTAAIFDAAQHWALRVDTNQEARCQAGKAISAASDWSAISHRNRAKAEFYAERPWLKRTAS